VHGRACLQADDNSSSRSSNSTADKVSHCAVVRSGRVGGRHTFAEQGENLERELDALVPDPVNEVRPVGDIVA